MEVSVNEIRAFLAAKRKALDRDKLLLYRPDDSNDKIVTFDDCSSDDESVDRHRLPLEPSISAVSYRKRLQANADESTDCDYGAFNELIPVDAPDTNHKLENNNHTTQHLECAPNRTNDLSERDIARILRKISCPNITMLKTGEYSPNNPDLAGEYHLSQNKDVFLGFGLYEERRKKLLQKRQNEYREYLAKQNQLNSLRKQTLTIQNENLNNIFFQNDKLSKDKNMNYYDVKNRRPSSVAVQTDPEEMMHLERKHNNAVIMLAERESSKQPLNANMPEWKMLVEKVNIGTQNNLIVPPSITETKNISSRTELLPSTYIDNKQLIKVPDKNKLDYVKDYVEQINDINLDLFRNDSPRARLLKDLSHTYMPSLFDAEAIQQRNAKMEEEANAKKIAYQLELKKQIEEQQKLKEERKAHERMLDEAETRRLEEQLKMLKLSQENEIEKQKELAIKMRNDAIDFEQRRLKLQDEIDVEKKKMNNMKSKPNYESKDLRKLPKCDGQNRNDTSVICENILSSPIPHKPTDPDIELLSYNVRRNNPHVGQDFPRKSHFSTNYADNSAFTRSIPVKNYNAGDVAPVPFSMQRHANQTRSLRISRPVDSDVIRINNLHKRPSYEPAFLNKKITDMLEIKGGHQRSNEKLTDSLPIPVLRESNKTTLIDLSPRQETNSEAMKNVERKWQVPAVQKNIFKNNVTNDGKQENILTQLGSIRKQLQLEQLKLDQHIYPKDT